MSNVYPIIGHHLRYASDKRKLSTMKRRERSHCPISFALDAFGDHWSLLVLRDIIFKGKTRYQEFLGSDEGISTNILADRLSRLEAAGIITRRDDPANGRQYIYAPTRKGLDLVPVMLEMVLWSSKHDAKTAAPEEFIRRLETDPAGLKREVLAPFAKVTGVSAKRKTKS